MAITILPAFGKETDKARILVTAPEGSEVTCRKGNVTKTAQGVKCRNLIPYTKTPNSEVKGYRYVKEDNGIFLSGASTESSGWANSNYVEMTLPAGSYCMCGNSDSVANNAFNNLEVKKADGSVSQKRDGQTFTLDGSEQHCRYSVAVRIKGSGQTELEFFQPMLVAGTEAVPFEPYYEGERFTFEGLDLGEWTVTASKNGQSAKKTVYVDEKGSYYETISYNQIPEFTYTGNYEIVDDSDKEIANTTGNWKIRLLTSGAFTFQDLRGAENGIDVFAVGGGANGGENIWYEDESVFVHGAGGGSGRTKTARGVAVQTNKEYSIVIGAPGNTGGSTSAFGVTASGGGAPKNRTKYGSDGGDGGSGGGGSGAAGGENGASGGTGNSTYQEGGAGQGSTTREFGETSGKLYASGGSGGLTNLAKTANTGDGGDGARNTSPSSPTSGAAGIVVIRNKR